jgi:hypothetical protein
VDDLAAKQLLPDILYVLRRSFFAEDPAAEQLLPVNIGGVEQLGSKGPAAGAPNRNSPVPDGSC